jgi:valyl-tRNA synthetase
MMVLRKDPESCSTCGSANIKQEEDVLDTWFSSWLWPFSTLGWPEKTEDLERFFPTSTLVTGYDIIFFWVARMIMASKQFMHQVPFRDIYITGLVRDIHGRKMSKSLGNGIDPLEVVDLYGADAMKFTLCFLAAQGQDILIDMESFKFGSKFANKIWNATRFLLMNLEGSELLDMRKIRLETIDRWIYHQFNEAAAQVEKAMKAYRFNDASQAVYEFFWNDFCDWYIEASKRDLYSKDKMQKDRAVTILIDLLEKSMRLLHPFVSFLTEEIYQKLPNTDSYVITAEYPVYDENLNAPEAAAQFSMLQDVVRSVRTLRSEFAIPPEKRVRVALKIEKSNKAAEYLYEQQDRIAGFVHASELSISDEIASIEGSVPVAGNGFEAFVFIRDAIDVPAEIAKLKKEQGKLQKNKEAVTKKLSNEKFLSNAPEAVVKKEKGKLDEFTQLLEKIEGHLRLLES